MGLVVVRPGLRSTIQDRGRPGYRGFGVPPGGAFDLASHDLANALVGNDSDAATLEMTLIGGEYRAEVDLAIALAGASKVGSTTLRAGESLILGGSPVGARTYLAVAGGWRTPLILGSRSSEAPIRAGDVLPARSSTTPDRRPAFLDPDPAGPIRVLDGPDGDARRLEVGPYLVTARADRMGLRLEGPPIDRSADPDRLSAPVSPGAVQVTGGQPIVLGVAGGTMGGYLHLAHVISADLDRIGQARPGDRIEFRRIEVEEARRLDRESRRSREAWLMTIREACRALL